MRILLLSLILLCSFGPTFAQSGSAAVSEVRLLGKTSALRQTTPKTASTTSLLRDKAKRFKPREVHNFQGNQMMPTPFAATAQPQGPDPVWQLFNEKDFSPLEPLLTIDGMDEEDSGIQPPDPVGAIGRDHFVQMVNSAEGGIFEVFDKEGNSVYGPALGTTLWGQFSATGLGDGIVIYDNLADRWVLSELGFFGTNAMFIGVSVTSDPLGEWYVYEVIAPDLPDYPKYGMWPNGYFITTNEPADSEIPIYCLDREAMLAGSDDAHLQRLGIPKIGSAEAFQVATPLHFQGSVLPPDGSPAYVVRIYDDAWEGGSDGLELWEIHIDWANPENSFTSGPISIPTAPFDSELCEGGDIFSCLTQSEGGIISALQQVVMFGTPYRNFGGYEGIALNFSVDVTGNNQSGVRWCELRRPAGGTWGLHQEGTYAPDENNRFMGSIGMDSGGNILMGYSVMGPNKKLSLRYTGRLASDPLGEMTIDEFEFAPGLSDEPSVRWGDYAAMTVDPQDQRTFWFTGEYRKADIWGTKITTVLLNRDTNDIGVVELVNPRNSGYLTDQEPVTVALRNFGYNAQHNIGISYSFQGGAPVTEMITDTIFPDSTYVHTFAPTVDLSAIGSYGFLIYSTLGIDMAPFNDTLRRVVRQLPRNDAALAGYQGTQFPICDTLANIDILFQNTGVDTLTSLQIDYQVDAVPASSIDWMGILPPGGIDLVSILVDNVALGDHELTAAVSLPNGVVDENMSNDSRATSFTLIGEGYPVFFELLTDEYPNETSWELADQDGNILYSGSGYNQANTTFLEEWCLEDQCYLFTIFDSYGDGLLGFEADGNYKITNGDGLILGSLQNVNFGEQEVAEFCADQECSLLLGSFVVNEGGPGQNNGRIVLTGNAGNPPFQFSINDGTSYQTNGIFNNVPGGVYLVAIKDAINCIVKDTVTVLTCTLELAAEVVNASTSQTSDGSISGMVNGGVPPFEFSLDGVNFQPESFFGELAQNGYILYVRDSLGCEQSLEVVIDAIVGLEPNLFGTYVQILPNPTDGFLRINIRGLNDLGTLPLLIYDSMGRVVKREKLVAYDQILTNKISLHQLPAGVYFIRFMDERLPNLRKVVRE